MVALILMGQVYVENSPLVETLVETTNVTMSFNDMNGQHSNATRSDDTVRSVSECLIPPLTHEYHSLCAQASRSPTAGYGHLRLNARPHNVTSVSPRSGLRVTHRVCVDVIDDTIRTLIQLSSYRCHRCEELPLMTRCRPFTCNATVDANRWCRLVSLL